MPRPSLSQVAAMEHITQSILIIRSQKVMTDEDLAQLYEVSVKALNQAVKRNLHRFPADFMFNLTNQEIAFLRSQIVTLKNGRGAHRKYPPVVFTEHGAYMLGNVLKSARAAQVSVFVVRAFMKLREILASNVELARRFEELEKRIENKMAEQDQTIVEVLQAIRQLMKPATPKRRPIGFTADLDAPS